jgi:hypothetical protein
MTAQRLLLRGAFIVSIALLCCAAPLAAQGLDYVTEEEEDLIRDAQDLKLRVPLFIKFLDNRIVALGLRERTAKEREQAKNDLADYQREVKAAAKVPDAEVRAKPVNPDVYLRNTPRTELLRGYMQIIDETMDYIEDAHERKLEVRSYVETLEKFLSEQMPRFEKLQTQSAAEASTLKTTVAHSKQAIEDCQEALKSLRKTVNTDRK